jgi:hypothetical protein
MVRFFVGFKDDRQDPGSGSLACQLREVYEGISSLILLKGKASIVPKPSSLTISDGYKYLACF